MDNQEVAASYLAGIYNRVSEQVELQKELNERNKIERTEARFFRRFILAWLVVGYYLTAAAFVWSLWKLEQQYYAIALSAMCILLHLLIYIYASSDSDD